MNQWLCEKVAQLKESYEKEHGKPATYLIVDNVQIWDIVKHNVDEAVANQVRPGRFPLGRGQGEVSVQEAMATASRTFAGLKVVAIIAGRPMLVTDREGFRKIQDEYDPE